MFKRISKRLCASVLSLCVLVSMATVGMVSGAAATDDSAPVGSETVSQYALSEVDTALLVPHTGKSSEADNTDSISQFGDALENADSYKENCITLSCDDELYDSLGFNSKALSGQAAELATSKEYQDPLAGTIFVDPKEMMLCQADRGDAFNTYFMSKQNQMINDASELSDNFDEVAPNTDVLQFHDDDGTWNNGPSNGVGIDIDQDGTDEWLYLTLSQKENDDNGMDAGSYVRLRLYDRAASGDAFVWTQLCEQDYFMHSQNYIYNHIPFDSSRGYLALTVGDFNGDGKEDLAFYAPDKSSDQEAQDAGIWIVSFTKSGDTASCQTITRLYLKDITADYGKMGDPWHTWHLPTVALSTTSTRLGEVTKDVGAKHYNTYDDLVVSVSVPREYTDDDLDLNSITAIYGRNESSGNIEKLFRYEYLPFDKETKDKRMNYVNTVDADLNGDGFKEIVVAGYKEENMHKPSNAHDDNRRYGDLVHGTNYVNIITYGEKGYEMLWEDPMEIKGQTNLSFYNSVEPIPLCAGHYLHGELALKDQVCIQGVVFNCHGTKISGTPVYTRNLGEGVNYYYITDTQPGCDKANFANVSFEDVYLFDLADHVSNDDEKVIDYCVSGRFFTASDVDQIVIVTSDPFDGVGDKINIDISVISDFPTREEGAAFSVQVYNDYFDSQEKEEDGTSLCISFIDSEDDTYYYRWTGTYATITAPSLYAIVQVPPYYKEANPVYEYSFTISTGVSNDAGLNVGLGVDLGSNEKMEFEALFTAGGSIEIETNLGLETAYNHVWGHEKEVATSIKLKSKEDCAVCYVMPIVVNTYEILETLDDPEPDVLSVSEPLDPIFTSITISQYNDALQNAITKYNYEKGKSEEFDKNETTDDKEAVENYHNQLSPETNAKLIDTDRLAITSYGDPSGYYHDRDELLKKTGGVNPGDQSDTDNAKSSVNIANNSSMEYASTDVTFADVDTNEGETGLSFEIGLAVGAKIELHEVVAKESLETTMSVSLGAQIGATYGRTNSNGVGFGVTYTMPERKLPDGVRISATDDHYTKTKGTITHYDPKNDQTYSYTANSICYQLPNYSVDRHNDDTETNVDMNDGNSVFVHTFYTTALADPVPAEPPEDFGVQSVRKNGDGSADVTLVWNSRHRSDERWADGYNIYVTDSGGNLQTVHLANKEAFIPSPDLKTEDYVPADTPLYTTYTVHLEKGFYTPNAPVSFYIAPAYRDISTGNVREGTLCAKATVGNIDNAVNGSLGIINQPEIYYMTRDTNDETAVFSIDAQKNNADGKKVSFIWQRYNREEGEWEDDYTDTPADQSATTFHSDYSVKIPGGEKDSYVDMGVRCVAEYDNFSVTSDVVTLRYIDQKPEPEIEDHGIRTYDELVAFAETVNSGKNFDNAYLENNITVPDGAVWTAGIGTKSKPFNGTFDGRGYGITGLRVDSAANGGLFDTIGTSGVVRDLSVVDCDFRSVSVNAGSVAAVNNGTIDHCTSGINLSGKIKINGIIINDVSAYNSYIRGTNAGGIAAVNNGTITGCRSSAVVEGVSAGGVTAVNNGTVYGSANNGMAGSTENSGEVAGGIAGTNYGVIASCYDSGKPVNKNKSAKGMIAGDNQSDDIRDVFYTNVDGNTPVGDMSDKKLPDASGLVSTDTMLSAAFVDTLNGVTDDSVTWLRAQYGSTSFNQGYPVISGRYLTQRTLTLQDGITVSSLMHDDLQITLEPLAADSEDYRALELRALRALERGRLQAQHSDRWKVHRADRAEHRGRDGDDRARKHQRRQRGLYGRGGQLLRGRRARDGAHRRCEPRRQDHHR